MFPQTGNWKVTHAVDVMAKCKLKHGHMWQQQRWWISAVHLQLRPYATISAWRRQVQVQDDTSASMHDATMGMTMK
jgi:hypothetical protein